MAVNGFKAPKFGKENLKEAFAEGKKAKEPTPDEVKSFLGTLANDTRGVQQYERKMVVISFMKANGRKPEMHEEPMERIVRNAWLEDALRLIQPKTPERLALLLGASSKLDLTDSKEAAEGRMILGTVVSGLDRSLKADPFAETIFRSSEAR